eukprot:gene25124-biopygen10423
MVRAESRRVILRGTDRLRRVMPEGLKAPPLKTPLEAWRCGLESDTLIESDPSIRIAIDCLGMRSAKHLMFPDR